MSINSINLSTFKQTFIVDEQNKKMYGEVSTDFHLVNRILDLLPSTLFENPNLKWLDPCAGRGYFSMVLYKRLFKSLQNKAVWNYQLHVSFFKSYSCTKPYTVCCNSE